MNDKIKHLQNEFVNGTTPKKLNGFYHGSLDMFIPETILDRIGGAIVRLWLPWRGKYFNAAKNAGDNILPTYLVFWLRSWFGEKAIGKSEYGGIHAFPFKMSVEKGLKDPVKIFRLDYNLPANPPRVRKVIDELMQVGKEEYLGKAHIVEGEKIKTVAFFRLKKP